MKPVTKKSLCVVLALVLALSLLPMTALADDDIITEVSILQLAAPVLGNNPDELVKLRGNGMMNASVVLWTDPVTSTVMAGTDTYNAAQDYYADIDISAQAGYRFPDTAEEITLTVSDSGYEAVITSITTSSITVNVKYHVLDTFYGASPDEAWIMTADPHTVEGGKEVYQDFVSTMTGYTVTNTVWTFIGPAGPQNAGDVFSGGNNYNVAVALAADEHTQFRADLEVLYDYNGDTLSADVMVSEDGKTATATYAFPDVKGEIQSYLVTGINIPVTGAEPQTGGFTAAGTGYQVGYVRWDGDFDGGKFKPGEHYSLVLSLVAEAEYTLKLDDKDSVAVNAGEVEALGSDPETLQPAITIGFDTPATPTFTVTFDTNGQGTAPAPLVVEENKSVLDTVADFSAYDPTDAPGYRFDGWFTEPECENYYNPGSPVTADTVVYAMWTKAAALTLDANGHGASEVLLIEENTAPDDDTLFAFTIPADADNYRFDGWYTEAECENAFDSAAPLAADTTVYAKWVKYYTVTFVANGHGTAPASLKVDEGQTIASALGEDGAVTPEAVEGYTFAGWYADASGINSYSLETPVTEDVKLYAKWEENNNYTVTFDANGHGTAPEPLEVADGETVAGNPEGEARYAMENVEGFTFGGWYTEAGCENAYDLTAPVTADITLYAKWTEDEPEPGPEPKENPFTDVKEDAFYYDAVIWAYYADPQVTNGMGGGVFGPDSVVTRGQAVTFLWRAMGCPEPTSTENPFTDVPEGEYFYKPVLWAVEKGITKGMTDTTFEPMGTLSTAHIFTFLYRTLGVGADGWYQDAADWAESLNLLDGMDITVSDKVNCPRADVVVALYRTVGAE